VNHLVSPTGDGNATARSRRSPREGRPDGHPFLDEIIAFANVTGPSDPSGDVRILEP
jgi:hypothetical protein